MATSFFWYELMTSDVPAAEEFYKQVVGWNTESFAASEMGYIIVKAGENGVGGMMTLPESAKQMGAGPAWLGYIKVDDVDAQSDAVKSAGGAVYQPPRDLPGGVGRMSVLADPQGAVFMMMRPEGPDMPPVAPMTPGHVGWSEYMGDDWGKAFDFYSGLFGWTKDQAVDMGEMGVYQLVAADGAPIAGMMNRPPDVPVNWGFYFIVEGIDAAAQRVTNNGGKLLMGPMEVPGGQWVVNCADPQGAYFGLLSSTK